MGIDYHVYVGPYIEVHNPPKAAVEQYHACPSMGCKQHMKRSNDKYCPQCGTTIDLVKKNIMEPIRFDVMGETNERLVSVCRNQFVGEKEHFLWIVPNQGGLGKHFYAYEPEVLSLNETDIALALRDLKEAFLTDITKLKKTFGNEAVNIRWGIIAYAS